MIKENEEEIRSRILTDMVDKLYCFMDGAEGTSNESWN